MIPSIQPLYNDEYFKHINQFSLKDRYTSELDLLCSRMDLKAGAKILDIGCGTGNALRYLRDNMRASVVGFEVSSSTSSYHQDLEVYYGNSKSLPFDSETFDAAILIHVIGHTQSPHDSFSEARRVIKPGGMIGIITPNFYFVMAHRPLNYLGIIPYRKDRTVLRYYTVPALYRELEGSGLTINSCSYEGPIPHFLSIFGASTRPDFLRERVIATASR